MAGLTPKSPSNLFPMHVPDSLLLGEKLKQLISYTFPLDCSLIALGLLMDCSWIAHGFIVVFANFAER